MLLRNKNTGIVGELHYGPGKEYHFTVATEDPADMAIYRSLAELNADWEDYKPIEPLIKDEKIRKAVRAWAEANEVSQAQFDGYTSGFSAIDDGHNLLSMISFDGFVFNCEDGKYYTITELCGEEE